MSIFDVLTFVGGLCLFLFGMSVMSQALERRAGSRLRTLLGKLTGSRGTGLLTGMGVTAAIQSSTAATVMVVGFVNSGLMSLRQAINVIMGVNVGTTLSAWIFSLSGISNGSFWLQMLKPANFTPLLALIGIILYLFSRSSEKKDTGSILLGFSVLIFGLESMSGAVSGLADVPAFQRLFLLFRNPLLGVLAGALLTAVIQSSSASVGILQVLAATGQVTYNAAIPIILGQNIGTCVTALLSSIGANQNAKRAASVHFLFNLIGSAVWLSVFWLLRSIWQPALLDTAATRLGIAVIHSVFNLLCILLLLPFAGALEPLVCRLVPDAKTPQAVPALDDRLLATPSVALERCRVLTLEMADSALGALRTALNGLKKLTPSIVTAVREAEARVDAYEDLLGTYLVRLNTLSLSEKDNAEAAKLLRVLSDFERISDYAANFINSLQVMRDKKLHLSPTADAELAVMAHAVKEVSELSYAAFAQNDLNAAAQTEPLVQVIRQLWEQLRVRHIRRLQDGGNRIEVGFLLSDLLTDLNRTAGHCSNISVCVIDMAQMTMHLHETLREARENDPLFAQRRMEFAQKYALP